MSTASVFSTSGRGIVSVSALLAAARAASIRLPADGAARGSSTAGKSLAELSRRADQRLRESSARKSDHSFRFVTNHAHVLEVVSADPTTRLRDIAATVGITERAVASIVAELEEAGYLTKTRNGRRNRYEVHDELPLRHPQHRHHTVGDLIGFLRAPD